MNSPGHNNTYQTRFTSTKREKTSILIILGSIIILLFWPSRHMLMEQGSSRSTSVMPQPR